MSAATSQLSAVMGRVKVSASMAITQAARDLRAAGRDIISLSAGEPDFDTPAPICAAAKAAIDAGETRYTAVGGTPALKQAIAEKLARDQEVRFGPDEILATSGAKFSIFLAMQATLNPGDEVIIPAPYWTSYPDQAALFGGVPVIVPTAPDDGFCLTPEALSQAITPRTKWLILNSPGNPSGGVYGRAAMEGLAEVLRNHPQVMILCDDIYEEIVFEEPFVSLLTVAPDLRSRVLIVNGVSKAYAMTGWRLGYGAGPEWLVTAMNTLAGQATSNPSSIAQAAAAAALTGDHGFLDAWRARFRARRDLVVDALNAAPGLSCAMPAGAFYAFPSCAGLIGKTAHGRLLKDDVAVAEGLLHDAGVALVPGAAFGLSPFFRVSYALDEAQLAEACARIAAYCAAAG